MPTEQDIQDFLDKVNFDLNQPDAASATLPDATVIRIAFPQGELEEHIVSALIKDEVIHRQFPDYWTSLFVRGQSTYGRF